MKKQLAFICSQLWVIIINGRLHIISEANIDKLAYISPQLLEWKINEAEKCLHFPGLAGIRITVGFLVGAGWIACSFVGSVLVGSWKGSNDKQLILHVLVNMDSNKKTSFIIKQSYFSCPRENYSWINKISVCRDKNKIRAHEREQLGAL